MVAFVENNVDVTSHLAKDGREVESLDEHGLVFAFEFLCFDDVVVVVDEKKQNLVEKEGKLRGEQMEKISE